MSTKVNFTVSLPILKIAQALSHLLYSEHSQITFCPLSTSEIKVVGIPQQTSILPFNRIHFTAFLAYIVLLGGKLQLTHINTNNYIPNMSKSAIKKLTYTENYITFSSKVLGPHILLHLGIQTDYLPIIAKLEKVNEI